MKDPTIQLWCEDEVHFQRYSILMRMWVPKGQQPHVPSASTREKVGFFGAVNLKTGVLVAKDAPTFNSETFGDFLDYLLQATQGKIYLILDNAKWHKAKALKDFSSRTRIVWNGFFCHPIRPNSTRQSGYGELPAGSLPTTVISLRSTNSRWL